MPATDDVEIESVAKDVGGHVFCRHFPRANASIRDQDVDLANLLEDGGDALKVRDRSGMSGDFQAWKVGRKGFPHFVQDFLSALDDDDMLDAGFGERLSDAEANASGWGWLVLAKRSFSVSLPTSGCDQDCLSCSIECL